MRGREIHHGTVVMEHLVVTKETNAKPALQSQESTARRVYHVVRLHVVTGRRRATRPNFDFGIPQPCEESENTNVRSP